jgi:hypothetical protein
MQGLVLGHAWNGVSQWADFIFCFIFFAILLYLQLSQPLGMSRWYALVLPFLLSIVRVLSQSST